MGAVTTKVGTTQTKNVKSSNRRFNVNYDTSTSGISASINYSGKKYRDLIQEAQLVLKLQ